jgi:hypothetical protein
MASEIIKMEGSSLLSLILLEISLVDLIFDLHLSLFLDLVMVDHESLTFIVGVVEGRLGKSSRVRGLEADESEVSVSSLLELDVFNGTELVENVLKLFFWPFAWEVLNVEVALLL